MQEEIFAWLLIINHKITENMIREDMIFNCVKKIKRRNKELTYGQALNYFRTYCKDFADDNLFAEFGGILTLGLGFTPAEAEFIHNFTKA